MNNPKIDVTKTTASESTTVISRDSIEFAKLQESVKIAPDEVVMEAVRKFADKHDLLLRLLAKS